MQFPEKFVWGASTAAYQIEGGADERGESIWDLFASKPGATYEGQNGDVACDHYHRYPEDVALMKQLGLQAYRMSISWPRILPEGIGAKNLKGIEFYDRLIDTLMEAGIAPWVTLFHWDYPLALHRKGGWLNPDSPKWFADYASSIVEKLSDRVEHWMTFNEPQVYLDGYWTGEMAPGDKLAFSEILLAKHHIMLAHGLGVQAIRANSKKTAKVGIAPVFYIPIPESESEEDVEFARNFFYSCQERSPWNMTWLMDPICFGRYPEDGLELFKKEMPKIGADDMKTIAQPLDFLGLNVYHGRKILRDGSIARGEVGAPVTAVKWPITPEALYWGPKFYWERYKKSVIITENGLSSPDWVSLDGQVHDPQRIDYTHRYLLELKRATNEGIDIGGYFHWSLMDNFEWTLGYRERFGLIHVDYSTQKRTPKDSYYWYRQVIQSHGECLGSS